MRRKYVLLWNDDSRIPRKYKEQIACMAGVELIHASHKYLHVAGGDFTVQSFANRDERWEAYAGAAE